MAVYLIRCVDQDAEGRHPYWNSKINRGAGGWVPDRIDATTYTQNQRDNLEDREKMHPRGMWERMDRTPEAFAEHLLRCLEQAVKAKPEIYFYGLDEVPGKARKMFEALKNGNAQIGPTAKRVARAMGLRPSAGSIQAFLNGGEGDAL